MLEEIIKELTATNNDGQHITARAMGRSKPALNSLKGHFKCADSSGDIHMVLLQICTTPLGQGLLSPATLLFNNSVHGVMPVIDRNQ